MKKQDKKQETKKDSVKPKTVKEEQDEIFAELKKNLKEHEAKMDEIIEGK